MKHRRNRFDVDDMNKKIIKEKMKNSLYLMDSLDKELLSVPYPSKNRLKKKKKK